FFFFSSRRRHTRFSRDWSSDVCSSDLIASQVVQNILPCPFEQCPDPARVGDHEATAVPGCLSLFLCGLRTRGGTHEMFPLAVQRSEERRVGKEGRARGTAERWKTRARR